MVIADSAKPPAESEELRVLCIDHEGGHGGASRSLFSVLRHISAGAAVDVWCRGESPLIAEYADFGIAARVLPDLPIWRVDPTLRGTLSNARRQLPEVWRNRGRTAKLADEIANRFDVVHLNYVSLQPLLYWLRRRTDCRVVMHMRHWPYRTRLVAWEMRKLSQSVDHFVFITENERAVFEALGGQGESTVIVNAAPSVNSEINPHPAIPSDAAFNLATVSNYAHAGKNVFVEKPLCLDPIEAQELGHLARRRGLTLMVGHLLLYHPAFRALPSVVEQGDLGKLRYIYSNRASLGKART